MFTDGRPDAWPLYRLVEEGSKRVILASHELTGFFVDGESVDVSFKGLLRASIQVGKYLEDVELQVVNSEGTVIGEYYIGRIRVLSVVDGEVPR